MKLLRCFIREKKAVFTCDWKKYTGNYYGMRYATQLFSYRQVSKGGSSRKTDVKVGAKDTFIATKDATMTVKRLNALRAAMANQSKPLAAYIIPTADAHHSEYIAPCDSRREWISGFTGSAGTAIVTSLHALVWTDGRYYTQFEKEVDLKHWTLMKQSLPDTPTMEKWLTSNLQDGAVVGVDPTTMTREEWTPLKTALTQAHMHLSPVKSNLVDEVRKELGDPAPARPANPLYVLPLKYTGKCAGDKVAEFRVKLKEEKASVLVITALDEVAYTLNLRGSDIQYNPVFFSYLIITQDKVILFCHNSERETIEKIARHLDDEKLTGVRVRPYGEVYCFLEELAKELSQHGDTKHSIWVPHDASEAISQAAAGGESLKEPLNLISKVSPVALAKLIKNDVELQGFRNCHIRDGTAVVRFLKWLEDQLDLGHEVTEVTGAQRLEEFRAEELDFMGPSFSTILGVGANGAIIHYTASAEGPQTRITKDDMVLLDSGGQYRDGTTDITRTRHTGTPTQAQKEAYTRVLKGQMYLGSAVFPKGVKGNVLDTLARKFLWDVGQDYGHGTGHGVGHHLNVHEGPSGVSWRALPHDPGLQAGQVLSNEPGYYHVGEYGIRHEDLVETINVTNDSDHPRAKDLIGDFEGRGVLGFKTLTLVPHHAKCIDVDLLTDFELSYLNAYHKRVFDTVGPILLSRGLDKDHVWLKEQCAALERT